jgi:hypothetical protein
MHEVATILMRYAPGWLEHQTSDEAFVFQNRDAIMTIFPDGSWRCTIPQGLTQAIRQGSVHTLERFLAEFAVANP